MEDQTTPNFFTLRVFIFIIYIAHFLLQTSRWVCRPRERTEEKRWEDVFRQQLYAFAELKTVGIIHLAISGKASEQRRAKKGKFLEDPAEKSGRKTWTLLHSTSRKHHERKRKKRRLVVFFIPYYCILPPFFLIETERERERERTAGLS